MNVETLVPLLMVVLGAVASAVQTLLQRQMEELTREKIDLAEKKVEREPDKAKPAWDLARVTLEAYFNRNLNQVTAIFWVSVVVMFVGFGIVIWGITQALQSPSPPLVAVITGSSGIITEFVGATFLFIYKSTMRQALDYTKTLERINAVGMAMQILDTIPDEATPGDLKSVTKAEVVKMLMKRSFPQENDSNTSVNVASHGRVSLDGTA